MNATLYGLLFAILRKELCQSQETIDFTELTDERLIALYKIAKSHDLAHIVGDVLYKEKIEIGKDLAVLLKREQMTAIYRYEQINYELQEICKILEEAKIEHIPLKGSVIRSYYPEPWLRTSCDIDILVKKERLDEAVQVLQERLQYTHEATHSHDAQLWAQSGVHLELHYDLIEDEVSESAAAVLCHGWERSKPCEGYAYRRSFDDAFFYLYHIAHMAKHFIGGGCGIRPFLDVWFLHREVQFDETEKRAMLQEAELSTFATQVEWLSEVWLNGKEHTEITKELEAYILRGGVYGSSENSVATRKYKKGSEFRYILYRIFPPYEYMCWRYPVLQKRKWAYPFYIVKRWFRIFKKGKVKRAREELVYLQSERVKRVETLLKTLELDQLKNEPTFSKKA